MTKSELVEKLGHKLPSHSKEEIDSIMSTVFEEITDTLEKGARVELRGFGSFSVRHRPERRGVDPRNGQHIKLEKRYMPFFKAGRILLKYLNS